MSASAGRRIAIVSPSLLAHDAVGNASAALYQGLASVPGNVVTLFTRGTDRTDVPTTVVTTMTDLMYNDAFLRADVLIYTYAIFSDLFDILLIGNGRAVQVVRFHNVTPADLVEERDRPLIVRSMRQLQVFRSADEIWADSQVNVEELTQRGIRPERVRVMPLGVNAVARGSLLEKRSGPVRFIYVGRIVPSKGVDELIEAAGLLGRKASFDFSLEICGNLRHSPPAFIQRLERRIVQLNLSDKVVIRGSVSTAELAETYRDAHVFVTASHHEGFCVPVIEGLAAGCVPVSYDNSNLRYIHGGLGRMAAANTSVSLAEAMHSVGDAIMRFWAGEPAMLDLAGGTMSFGAFAAAAEAYVAQFDPALRDQRVRERVEALTAEICVPTGTGEDPSIRP